MYYTKIIISILLILTSFIFGRDDMPLDLTQAENQYTNGEYQNFLATIKKALINHPSLRKDLVINAKIAYSLYNIKHYSEADLIWQKVIDEKDGLNDYYGWFRGLNALSAGDTVSALSIWNDVTVNNPKSSLKPKLYFYSAELSAALKKFKDAFNYMSKLYKSGKTAGHSRAFILGQLIKYTHYLNSDSLRNIYLNKLIVNYPDEEEAFFWFSKLDLAGNLKNLSNLKAKLFLDIFLKNEKNKEGLNLVKRMEDSKYFNMKNTFKFYRAEFKFNQKKYYTAYKLYHSLPLKQFNLNTQKKILYQKSRCLYRTGQRRAARNEFLRLAKRFPNWRKGQELLWVAGINYEVKKQFKNAAYWYKQIIKLSPNSEYAWKSRFRIGFNDYLQKKYKKAIDVFSQTINSKIWYLWRDRAKYWTAKCYEALGEFDKAIDKYGELASKPVANYYSMKSYLLLKSISPDSVWMPQSSYNPANSLFALDMEFDTYVEDFKRVLTIDQIFGNELATDELNSMKIEKNRELSYYIALVRLYRKIGEYGHAYRLQSKLINQYFSNLPLTFQSPTIKYLFPLFYDDVVFDLSNELHVEPELVFAVMRQESAFQEDAESRAGAFGLLQLMPGTARNLHVRYIEEPWDLGRLIEPDYNIQLGLYYLSGLISRYNGIYYHVFVAYNAGPNRLKRWRKSIKSNDMDVFVESLRFNETRTYVRKCMRNYWVYKIILGASPLSFYNYLKDGHLLLGAN